MSASTIPGVSPRGMPARDVRAPEGAGLPAAAGATAVDARTSDSPYVAAPPAPSSTLRAEPRAEAAEVRTFGSILSLPLVWAIRLYQVLISPLLPQQCRFYPSCSAYAVTALQRFGPLKGSWLAIRRLGRCHPWNPGGVDHVPAREHEPGARCASP